MGKTALKVSYCGRLGFMFRKISMSGTPMAYWLSVPEFEAEMLKCVEQNRIIDNSTVYDIARKIYNEWDTLRSSAEEKPNFNYSLARRGLHQLEKALNANNH